MSNEELCVLISSGKKELLSDLYIQNKGIIYKHAYRFYNRHAKRCMKCGVELEDLENEAFFALCEAVEAYCKGKEYKFTSYLRYPLQIHFNELIGYRTSRTLNEPLNNSISLDKPIDGTDSENINLIDTIIDNKAEFEENVVDECAISGLFPAVKETLKDDFAYNCIDMNYRQGISCREIAEKYGFSNSYISSIIKKAFQQLRKKQNTPFTRACQDVIDASYHKHGVSTFKYTGMSSTEWAALKMIKKEELKYFD